MGTYKDDVCVATIGNIALSGTQTIDGVVLAVGDRVLVKDQTTASQNGIYTVASGGWSRATDANTSGLMSPETTMRVSQGTLNAHTEWSLTTQASITLDTTPLTFVQQPTAANPLVLYGTTTKPMVDADQTLSSTESARAIVKTTGALTAKRRLAFPAPASEVYAFQRTVLNACTGDAILVTIGTGSAIEIEPGAKAMLDFTPAGVRPVLDLPLDPRDFGCPWNGIDDDLPGLQAMLASIPADRARLTRIQLPMGEGYCSGDLDVNRRVEIMGYGKSYSGASQTQHGLKFPPLRGLILHGYFSSPDFAASPPHGGRADDSMLRGVNILSTQAIVSDAGGNWGDAMFQLDTSHGVWNTLPETVPLGTCVIRSNTTVGSSSLEYYGDGHTRNTIQLVMFRCTTSGSKGTAEPNAFATASLAQIGTTITASGGTGPFATWTVESIPKDYENHKSYVAGERVVIPGDPDHVFEAMDGGTSLALAATTITAASSGQALLQTTIDVADTTDFPCRGIICIATTNGRQFVTYTAKTATTFTECQVVAYLNTPSGTMSTGGTVTGPFPWAPWGIPVRCSPGFVAPAHDAEFHDRMTAVHQSMNGLTLPQTHITVDSTADFASSGTMKIWTGTTYETVAYTSKTTTQFQGCTGGTGTLATGQEIGQGIRWKHLHAAGITVLANWCTVENSMIAGATGAAIWIQAAYKKAHAGGSNFWAVRNCTFHACGDGLVTNSNNTNGGESAYCQQTFLGAGRTNVDAPAYLNINGGTWANGRFGNGGAAVKDRTQGNNMHRVHYIQFSGGMPFRNDLYGGEFPGGNASRWDYLAAETEIPALFISPALVSAAVHGVSKLSNATVIAGAVDSRDIRSATPLVSDGTKRLISTHGPQSPSVATAFNFSHEDDPYPFGFSITDDQILYPPKWFTFGKTNRPGFFTEQLFLFPRPHPAGATWPSGERVGATMPMWIAQDRVWIGAAPNVDPASIGFASGTPPAGWFCQGSVMFDRSADGTNSPGWQYVATETPGTWTPIKGGRASQAIGDLDSPTVVPVSVYSRELIQCTGTLTADRTLQLPHPGSDDASYRRTIQNATAGGCNLVVSTGTGSTVTVASGTRDVWCTPDGVQLVG